MLFFYPQNHFHFDGISHHDLEYGLLTRQYRLEQERRLRVERQRQIQFQRQRIQAKREEQAREAQLQLLTAFVASIIQETPALQSLITSERYAHPTSSFLGYDNRVQQRQCSSHGACSRRSCLYLSTHDITLLSPQSQIQPSRPAWCGIANHHQQPRRRIVPAHAAEANPFEALINALEPLNWAEIKTHKPAPVHAESFSDPDLLDIDLLSKAQAAPKAQKTEVLEPKAKPATKKLPTSVASTAPEPKVRHVTFEDIIRSMFEEQKKEYDLRRTKSTPNHKASASAQPAPNKAPRDPNVTLERKPAIRKSSVSIHTPTPTPIATLSVHAPESVPVQSPITTSTESKKASPKPKSKAEYEAEKETEAAAAAAEQARLIRRYDSLASLSSIRSDFLIAQEKATGSPRSAPIDFEATLNESEEVEVPSQPRSPSPAGKKVYEETLLRLLERLDGVESDGDDIIRFTRRSLARELADELEILDKLKVELEEVKENEVKPVTGEIVVEVQSEVEVAPVPVSEPVVYEELVEVPAIPRLTPQSEDVSGPFVAAEVRGDDNTASIHTEFSEEASIDESKSKEEPVVVADDSVPISTPVAEEAVSTPVQFNKDSKDDNNNYLLGNYQELPVESATVHRAEESSEPTAVESVAVVPSHTQLVNTTTATEVPVDQTGESFPVFPEVPQAEPESNQEVKVESEEVDEAPPSTSSSSSSDPDISHPSEVEVEEMELSLRQAPTEIGSDLVVLSDDEDEEGSHSEVLGGNDDNKFELV